MKARYWILIITLLIAVTALAWFIYDINCTHGIYRINIKSECVYNDSVGREWEETYKMDGKTIVDGEELTLSLNDRVTKVIRATITEIDKYSDTDSKNIIIDIKDAEEASVDIIVMENNGRYRGNTAKWKITVSVKLIKKIIQI